MNEPMTLTERLRNPEWVHGPDLNAPAQLSIETTRKDMNEAANEIDRLSAAPARAEERGGLSEEERYHVRVCKSVVTNNTGITISGVRDLLAIIDRLTASPAGQGSCATCHAVLADGPQPAACYEPSPASPAAPTRGGEDQTDKLSEKQKTWLRGLKAGAAFYCHKGVPIESEAEHGFAYPTDTKNLRLCRGYLNALGKWWKAGGAA